MRSDEKIWHKSILEAAGAGNERELPGAAQRALRTLATAGDRRTHEGVLELVRYAYQRGGVDALGDADALRAELGPPTPYHRRSRP